MINEAIEQGLAVLPHPRIYRGDRRLVLTTRRETGDVALLMLERVGRDGWPGVTSYLCHGVDEVSLNTAVTPHGLDVPRAIVPWSLSCWRPGDVGLLEHLRGSSSFAALNDALEDGKTAWAVMQVHRSSQRALNEMRGGVHAPAHGEPFVPFADLEIVTGARFEIFVNGSWVEAEVAPISEGAVQ